MAKIAIQYDWSGPKAVLLEAVDPKGDIAKDKKDVIKLVMDTLQAVEKSLEEPKAAMATAPVARAQQANTKASLPRKK